MVHFFIPMLLLPQTPNLIYLKLKKNKGPKMDSLHLTFSLSIRSIAGIAQHSIPISIKESSFLNKFPLIWVSSIFSKNWTQLQFYKRNVLLKISCLQFCMKNPFKFFFNHPNFSREIPLNFLRKKKWTLKFCLKFTGKSLYKIFIKKNPCKI